MTNYNYYTGFAYPNFVHSESFLVLGPQKAVKRKVMCDGGGGATTFPFAQSRYIFSTAMKQPQHESGRDERRSGE